MKILIPKPQFHPLAGSLLILLATLAAPAHAGPPPYQQSSTGDPAPSGVADFQAQDSNGDGTISIAEFIAERYPERAFQEADANHDGQLDRAEYLHARRIGDRLAVSTYLKDSWITTKVKTVLVSDQKLDGLSIGVETYNGVVQLSGWVDHTRQAVAAAEIASNIEGVRRVLNTIQVKG